MIDLQKWIDRIDNLMQIQKEMSLDIISAKFTRQELIDLHIMISVLKELESEEYNGKTIKIISEEIQ